MKNLLNYRIVLLVSFVCIVFASCSKKSRCSDCPKFSKATDVEQNKPKSI